MECFRSGEPPARGIGRAQRERAAFVTELNSSGNALVYSTYLGGNGRNRGFGIALGPRNNAYVTGFTDALNFPVTSGAFQTSLRGRPDVFVTRIDDTAPDFALYAAGSSSASVNCGQTANYDLQLISFNGFAGAVGITCSCVARGGAGTRDDLQRSCICHRECRRNGIQRAGGERWTLDGSADDASRPFRP